MSRTSVETNPLGLPDKDALLDQLTAHICTKKCMGNDGLSAGCCTLGTRNYIIGPIPDSESLLSDLSARFGRTVPFDEVFVTYEEGKDLFPDLECWQDARCYPALRVNMDDPSLGCRFLDDDNLCSIHDIRSITCRKYLCDHIKSVNAQL